MHRRACPASPGTRLSETVDFNGSIKGQIATMHSWFFVFVVRRLPWSLDQLSKRAFDCSIQFWSQMLLQGTYKWPTLGLVRGSITSLPLACWSICIHNQGSWLQIHVQMFQQGSDDCINPPILLPPQADGGHYVWLKEAAPIVRHLITSDGSDVQVCHQSLWSSFDLFWSLIQTLTLTLTPPPNNGKPRHGVWVIGNWLLELSPYNA